MSGKDNSDDFALPDVDFLFTHEVEDKEHPVYKHYGSEEYQNAEYEDKEDELEVENPPVKRSKPRESKDGVGSRQNPRRRADGRTGAKNGESKEGKRPPRRKKRKKRPVDNENIESKSNMHVDKKTGLTYELLPGSDKEAIKAYSASNHKGLGINEIFKYTDSADGFDGFDLVADAKRFLPHMRVPISQEERQRALKKLKDAKAREEMRRLEKEEDMGFE